MGIPSWVMQSHECATTVWNRKEVRVVVGPVTLSFKAFHNQSTAFLEKEVTAAININYELPTKVKLR